jgi:hypothetical protein
MIAVLKQTVLAKLAFSLIMPTVSLMSEISMAFSSSELEILGARVNGQASSQMRMKLGMTTKV